MTAISGDTGSPTSRTTGTTSQWLKIRVSENDSGVFGAKLKVRLTLTSPSSANFDMRVYVPNDGSSQKCTGADRQTSSTVGPDVASVEWGEAIKAVAVLRPGMQVAAAELIQWCDGRIAGYKKPKSVDFVATLPRNATGKVLHRQLREPYWKNEARKI